jgi:CRP-like cAMP-binding protein
LPDTSIDATTPICSRRNALKLHAAAIGPTGNRLLAALPREEYRKLLPHLELKALPFGSTLSGPGVPIEHAYFPTTAIVSLVTPIEGHGAEEVAVVGGMIGVSLVLEGAGAHGPPYRAIVYSPRYAYRVRADELVRKFDACPEVQHLLLRYTQPLISQIAQTAICNRHHRVEQQLCRWLLQRLDRSRGFELPMTQQWIADLLGVRRESVTQAMHALQCAGVVRCLRGRMTVLNRSALERGACECYADVAKEHARPLAVCTSSRLVDR